MKKKILLLMMCVCSFTLTNAQVGINTDSPLGTTVLHIDGAGDNNNAALTPAQKALNDVVVTKDGNVGIGTIAPQYKLEINSGGTAATPIPALQIKDGNQRVGRVLTSDLDGVATWQNLGAVPSAVANFNKDDTFELSVKVDNFISTGTTLTLLPGTWLIYVSILMNPIPQSTNPVEKYWVRSTFAMGDVAMGTTVIPSTDFVGRNNYISGLIDGYAQYSVLSGYVKIKNSTATAKMYTFSVGAILWASTNASFVAPGQGQWSEDSITAILLQDE